MRRYPIEPLDQTAGPAKRPAARGSSHVGPGATVRIAPLTPLPALLGELGVDAHALLREAGFDRAYFDDPDLPVSYLGLGRLVARCVDATGCAHLGLLLGMRGGPETVGVAGHLMKHASNVGAALADLARYLDLHDRGGVATLDVDADTCALGYAVIEPGMEAPDQIHDLALAIACNMMRTLCGRSWTPSAVELPRRRPHDAEPWRRFFGAPIRFDTPRAALLFPRRWLEAPVPTADRSLHDFLRRHADSARGEAEHGVVFEARRVVRGCIAEGGGHAAQVAQLLGVHPRTLSRQLAAAGTTFQQVRDEVLHAMALQLLHSTSMSVADAAAALGYADSTAFIRAFSRWTGRTPARWRREAGGVVAGRSSHMPAPPTPHADRASRAR